MKWIEIKLSVESAAADAIADLLQRYAHQGVSVEQEGPMPVPWADPIPAPERFTISAYLPDDARAVEAKNDLETALSQLQLDGPTPKPIYTVLDDTDWAEAWKVHYKPLRLGQHIVIRPLWEEDFPIGPDDIELALDPGMAFGTGTHPTTQLCLLALEDQIQHGQQVLDLGTGSAILAIAAAKMGAASVLALDTDPVAIEAAEENIRENHVSDKITAQVGGLESVLHAPRRFDLALVNILARVIIPMCEQGLGQVIRPGGTAIFSGLIEEQAADVEAALRKTGLEPFNRRYQGDWVAIEARRPQS